MKNTSATVVWFKRDLRMHDHAPLSAAASRGPVIPLFIVEPAILGAADADAMHYRFLRECLIALREALAARGQPLIVRVGEATAVLAALHAQTGFDAVYAHEETGNALTFARDRAVADWARHARVAFDEWTQTGVVRRLASRNGWSKVWHARMSAPQIATVNSLVANGAIEPGDIPTADALGLHDLHPAVAARDIAQRGGEQVGLETLHSFLEVRGHHYHREISAPQSAAVSGSRISAYLAYGAVSLRYAVQCAQRSDLPKRAKRAFVSRLHWHCHFMQKLESQPSIEWQCFNPLYETLRDDGNDQQRLDAWCNGRTGYPFVDACIRSLQTTGWLNFRMRAMLVSFAAYDLWLDWRSFRDFLARQFLDYEPGIHISQLQMQSGVTGINTPRIYNPVKQGLEHDPTGSFTRLWVPEVRQVPHLFVHEPWKMSAIERVACNVDETGYPSPVVEHLTAIRKARQRIAEVRNSAAHREHAGDVFERHGSRRAQGERGSDAADRARRKSGRDAARFDAPKGAKRQLSLFD